MIDRRRFLATLAALPAAPALVGLTQKGGRPIAGDFVEDDAKTGHLLGDDAAFRPARERRRVAVAIVGGGIGGLSAGWRLDALGVKDWMLLELGEAVGGNARGGGNAVSRYPWGAHYLPIPSADASHVRALLREVGALEADGSWNERMLCHSPQERLFQHGRWHEGLEPFDALSARERDEFARFDESIAAWRESGAFAVPTVPGHARGRRSALARAVRTLDGMSAAAWFRQSGYTSPALRWWIEYGTRDDYGASLESASAWAAVHYFAGRPKEEIGPLTWPEGNEFLVRALAGRGGRRIMTGTPATRIERSGTGGRWLVRSQRMDLECDVVIWAAPLFVLPRVLTDGAPPVKLEYAPWVVANLTLSRAPRDAGEGYAEPAWDNVLYDSPSLGYVDATHQTLGERGDARVWTWYHAIVDREPRAARGWLTDRPWSAWRDEIIADLSRAHPDIAACVTRIDVRRWGHAMVRPTPGLLSRVDALAKWRPAPRMFVAHADLSGLSLFEEAQWHGVLAAEQAAKVLGG